MSIGMLFRAGCFEGREREKKQVMIQERKAEGELRGKADQRREKCRKEKSTVKLVWNNVRKIRTRKKRMELEVWMKKNECDVCAINETGLNGNEYVEVSDTNGLVQMETG